MSRADINISKDYFYTSPGKEKHIPIIWNGSGTPAMAQISNESLVNKPFTEESAGFKVSEEAKATDDWGNELSINDFVSDTVLVKDIQIDRRLDKAVKSAYPGNLNWKDADVEWKTDETGNITVSNYSKYDLSAFAAARCLYPWKYSWDYVTSIAATKENMDDDENTSNLILSTSEEATPVAKSVTRFEPPERRWTENAEFEIVVNPFAPGKPDFRIKNSRNSSVNGLYKMVDLLCEGLERRWYCSSTDKYILYNSENKRWEICNINNYNGVETINTICYQYSKPTDMSWLYNVTETYPKEFNGRIGWESQDVFFVSNLSSEFNGYYEKEEGLIFRKVESNNTFSINPNVDSGSNSISVDFANYAQLVKNDSGRWILQFSKNNNVLANEVIIPLDVRDRIVEILSDKTEDEVIVTGIEDSRYNSKFTKLANYKIGASLTADVAYGTLGSFNDFSELNNYFIVFAQKGSDTYIKVWEKHISKTSIESQISLSLDFPYYGAIVMNSIGKTDSPELSAWKFAKSDNNSQINIELVNGNLKVVNTVAVDYGKSSILYGNWGQAGAGITVEELSEDELKVSGYSDNDVNGVYELFEENIWVKKGISQVYAIKYDTDSNAYHLVSTYDGIYSLDDATREDEYRTWTYDGGSFSNSIFFNRSLDKWVLKTSTSRHFDYVSSMNSNFLEGDDIVWTSLGNGLKSYIRYDRNKACWIAEDEYNNIISANLLLPSYWETNEAEAPILAVFNSTNQGGIQSFDPESGVTLTHSADIYSTGLYEYEDFKAGMSDFSFIYDPVDAGDNKVKICYLVYDFENLQWKLTEKLNVSGVYLLEQDTLPESLSERRWSKGTIFNIHWDNGAWSIFDNQGRKYYNSMSPVIYESNPEENIWSNTCEVVKSSNALITVSGIDNGNGLYKLVEGMTNNDKPVWRSGSLSNDDNLIEQVWVDGDYWLTYNVEESEGGVVSRWEIHYLESKVNGEYLIDNSTEPKQWKKETGSDRYWISFDNYTWVLSKRKADDTIEREMAVAEPAFLSTALTEDEPYWESGCSMSFENNDTDIIVISNRSDSANGTYYLQSHREDENPLNWEWKYENASLIYYIRFDYLTMNWTLQESDQTCCATYSVTEGTKHSQYKEYEYKHNNTTFSIYQPEAAYYLADGQNPHIAIFDNNQWAKLPLLIDYPGGTFDVPTADEICELVSAGMIEPDGVAEKLKNGWILKRSNSEDESILAFQLFNAEFPYSKVPNVQSWSIGTVENPFENARLFDVIVPFDLTDEQFFGYSITFKNLSLNFDIIEKLPNAERKWRAETDTGNYILEYISNYYWAIFPENFRDYKEPWYAQIYAEGSANEKDLSSLTWRSNQSITDISVSRKSSTQFGVQTYHMKVGYIEDNVVYSSNEVTFRMEQVDNNILVGKTILTGSSGNENYTGFYIDENGRFRHTSLVNLSMYASSPLEIRVKIDGGLTVPGLDFKTPYSKNQVTRFTGKLDDANMAEPDKTYEIHVTVQDMAGNLKTADASIVHIGRLWRMEGLNIKEDSVSYRTRVFDMKTNYYLAEIAKTSTLDTVSNRGWNDIFYPESHGYPTNADGTPDVKNMLRISNSTIDENGVSGPTSAETKVYDKLQLSNDGSSLATDYDGRTITSGWTTAKQYESLESSSPSSMKYWVIDNTGYNGFKLEFEYFDLNTEISTPQPNGLSPYQGDVLVIYDASQEGAVVSSEDVSGKIIWRIADSTKLHKLGAISGSGMTGVSTIAVKDGSQFDITLTASGFETSTFSSVSRICMILYTDSAYEASGFKLKAGPRRDAIVENYTLSRNTGEVWVHQRTDSGVWCSPARVATTHQYTEAVATVDCENGLLNLSSRSNSVISGSFAYYNYLWKDGEMLPPRPNLNRSGLYEIRDFILSNDDCVDYYEVALAALPTGTVPLFNYIYDYADLNKNFGKICEYFTVNKDEGTVSFTRRPPLGRIIGNYTYHTFYRLTSDGSGDLNFYANAVVPSNDYASTGLKDWTYVDVMLVNEGNNALSNGIMKFAARGSVGSSGSSQIIKSVIDENRPWDIQSGTIAETVNRTGASFSQTFSNLAEPTRRNAITAIGNSTGGVTFGQALLPKSKAFVRIFWCLCTNDSNPAYIPTTRGQKLWSSELSGNYFVVTV